MVLGYIFITSIIAGGLILLSLYFVFLDYSSFKREERAIKRVKEWKQFAKWHGLNFQEWDYQGILGNFDVYSLFQSGYNKHVCNLCFGKKGNMEICTFDYPYDPDNEHAFATGLLITSPFIWQSISIYAKDILGDIFDRNLSEVIRFENIKFESAEFSKQYYVKCEDKKFAYDIIHPQIMELLLHVKYLNLNIETLHKTVLFRRIDPIPISEMDLLLETAIKFIDLIPEYLKK